MRTFENLMVIFIEMFSTRPSYPDGKITWSVKSLHVHIPRISVRVVCLLQQIFAVSLQGSSNQESVSNLAAWEKEQAGKLSTSGNIRRIFKSAPSLQLPWGSERKGQEKSGHCPIIMVLKQTNQMGSKIRILGKSSIIHLFWKWNCFSQKLLCNREITKLRLKT